MFREMVEDYNYNEKEKIQDWCISVFKGKSDKININLEKFGALILTNQRVLLLSKEEFGYGFEDEVVIPLEDIKQVNSKEKLLREEYKDLLVIKWIDDEFEKSIVVLPSTNKEVGGLFGSISSKKLDFDDATEEYIEKINKSYVKNLKSMYDKAQTIKKKGKKKAAVNQYDKILEYIDEKEEIFRESVNLPKIMARIGQNLYELGKKEKSLELFNRSLEMNNKVINQLYKFSLRNIDDPELWLYIGDKFTDIDNKKKAADAYGKAIINEGEREDSYNKIKNLDPEDPDLIFREAKKLEERGYVESADFLFGKIIDDHPEDLDLINDIISIQGKSTELLEIKANILENQGKEEEALEVHKEIADIKDDELAYLDKALKINPDDIDLLYKKGSLTYQEGKYEEALEAYDKLLGLDEENIDVLYNKGACHFNLDELDKAIESFNRGLEIDEEELDLWFYKGVALYKKDKYQDSMDSLNEVVKRDQERDDAWYYKAKVAGQQGKEKLVKAFLKRATSLNDEYKEKANKDDAFAEYKNEDFFKEIVG